MKIGIAQIQCTVGDIPANCERMAARTRQARDLGCEVVVFPEVVDTGYYLPAIYKKAFSWEGEPFEGIKGLAREAGIHLVCGLSERAGDKIYNTMAVIDPGVGIEVLAKIGDRVEAGQPLATVTWAEADRRDQALALLEGAFAVADEPVEPPPLIHGEVS